MPESWKQWEGRVVDRRFPLFRYLGGSDHSAVFLTQGGQPRPERLAIKLIPVDPRGARAQLDRWAQAARLSHPHLIRLFECGNFDMAGVPLLYVVMEYAEENLSQVLPQRALSDSEAEDMLTSLLETLDFLHGRGFIHGHLRPSNIMAAGNVLKLTTDGLSSAGESGVRLASNGAYSAPEALTGTLSPASDVWALGVTLVEALTQRAPSFYQINRSGLAVARSMPAPFGEIVQRCLASDPGQRPSLALIRQQLKAKAEPRQERAAPSPGPMWRYLVPVISVIIVLALFIVFLVHNSKSKSSPAVISEPAKAKAKPNPAEPNLERPSKGATSENSAPSSPKLPGGDRTEPWLSAPGVVVHEVIPHASPRASDTIQGTVRVAVRVTVDPSGDVTNAEFESHGPSEYFARLAMEAARKWKFTPAESNGQNLAREWILRFQFRKTGTNVIPRQVAP